MPVRTRYSSNSAIDSLSRFHLVAISTVPTRAPASAAGKCSHLSVIAWLARVDQVDPVGLRRNLVVSGINQPARAEACAVARARCAAGDRRAMPTRGSRMEEAIGPGGYAAMRVMAE
jgi:hypothetical protein